MITVHFLDFTGLTSQSFSFFPATTCPSQDCLLSLTDCLVRVYIVFFFSLGHLFPVSDCVLPAFSIEIKISGSIFSTK